jgi:hypothetical protein
MPISAARRRFGRGGILADVALDTGFRIVVTGTSAAPGRPAPGREEPAMGRYQLREDDGSVVAEESFESFETANAWAIEADAKPGWTLFQQIGGDWTPARFDPS